MVNSLDPVLGHHTSQERQPAAVPELPNDHPHHEWLPMQSHAEDQTEQTEATSGEDIAEEQADFRAGGSTKQIFSLRILCKKYLWHQQDIYHVFIDFTETFDRVWHAALWATMKKYNISTNFTWDIKYLCAKAPVQPSSTAA